MFIKVFNFLIIMSIFSVQGFSQENQEPNKEMQEAYFEYQQVSQQLQSIQKQALNDSAIAVKSEKFSNKLESAMIEQDSSVKQTLEKREKIIENFEEAQQNENREKIVELQKKYQAVLIELQSHQQQAMQDEELLEQGKELEEAVIQKMTEINPEVPDLFARLEKLGKKLQGMQGDQVN